MFTSIEHFKAEWIQESQSTLKILNNLTDESLSQKVYPEGRTLGKIAWHIVETLGEMPSHAGLNCDEQQISPIIPKTANEISTAYEKASNLLLGIVTKNWNDDMLAEEIELYGEKWKRGMVLDGVMRHEIHHRGQMTVLMRQAGLLVPGAYGPSKEEWAQYGMQVHD